MIGPTDLLHTSPAPHFKTFQVSFVISDEILRDTGEYLELRPVCADVRSGTSIKPDCDYMTHNDTNDYIPG